ncbi:gsl4383 [Gloeobacter violaceus PCC 7421]|nr:iron-sulfur cluster assembly scaffold protein [Gloeobacter violaceus]BAC92324.1 gsl4383 [Gloeobacter violaceus PCC 7421]
MPYSDKVIDHYNNLLSLPPVKIHCSVPAEDAMRAAVADYQAEQSKTLPTQE